MLFQNGVLCFVLRFLSSWCLMSFFCMTSFITKEEFLLGVNDYGLRLAFLQ
jgi:hypothetical protein